MSERTAVYPEQLLHVISLRRAGQHLLVKLVEGWLAATGLGGVHINDADNNLPFGHPDRREWTAKKVLEKGIGRHTVVTNYEDYPFSYRYGSPVYAGLRATGLASRDILLVRDYPNFVATRMMRLIAAEKDGTPHKFSLFSLIHGRDIWIDHAKTAVKPDEDGLLVVLYNRLVRRDTQGVAYREKLAAGLGLMASDAGLDHVPNFGGGSSFDGRHFDGDPAKMKVLSRWQALPPEHHGWFLDVINDPEADVLNHKLFGFGAKEVAASLAIASKARPLTDTLAQNGKLR